LTARIEELEEEVAFLRARVAKLEANERRREDEFDEGEPIALSPKGKGRPQRLSDGVLQHRLYELLIRLNGIWPQFQSAFKEAKDADQLSELLVEMLPGRDGDLVFQELLRHRNQMWSFMTSDRYNGTHEQFACAMAGVPKMTPRSSLDRCSKLLPLENFEDPYEH